MKIKFSPWLLFAFFIIITLIDSLLLSLRWGCPLLMLTGTPCPGCGMSRAFLAFFRLDLVLAFYYHPMFLLLLMILVFCLIYIIWQITTYKRQGLPLGWVALQNASDKLFSSKAFLILLALFFIAYLVVYVVRVILPLLGFGDPSTLDLLRFG